MNIVKIKYRFNFYI